MNTDVFLRVASVPMLAQEKEPLISADRTLIRQAEAVAGTD